MKYYYIEEAMCNRKQALKTEGYGFDIADHHLHCPLDKPLNHPEPGISPL